MKKKRIKWTPEKIDEAYDGLYSELGRVPKTREFGKRFPGALKAIYGGRYDESISTWSEFVAHKSKDIVKALFEEYIENL